MRLRHMLALGLASLAGAAGAEVELRLSTGTAHALPAAEEALFSAFFGGTSLGGITLQDSNGAAFNLGQGTGLSVRVTQVLAPLGPRSRVLGGLALSQSEQGFRLDEGIGIFTDPARVTLRTRSLWADVALQRDIAFGIAGLPMRGDVTLGLGAVESRFRAHLTSALLDVRAEGRSRAGYLRAGIALDLGPRGQGGPQPGWHGELTVFDNRSWDLTTGLGLSF